MNADNKLPHDSDSAASGSELDKLIQSVKDNLSHTFEILLMLIGVLFIVFLVGSIFH